MGRIAGRFTRVEPRLRTGRLVLGLLSDLPRKNCWTIAEWAGEAGPHGMQHLLCRAVWDADGVRDDVREYVVEHLYDRPRRWAVRARALHAAVFPDSDRAMLVCWADGFQTKKYVIRATSDSLGCQIRPSRAWEVEDHSQMCKEKTNVGRDDAAGRGRGRRCSASRMPRLLPHRVNHRPLAARRDRLWGSSWGRALPAVVDGHSKQVSTSSVSTRSSGQFVNSAAIDSAERIDPGGLMRPNHHTPFVPSTPGPVNLPTTSHPPFCGMLRASVMKTPAVFMPWLMPASTSGETVVQASDGSLPHATVPPPARAVAKSNAIVRGRLIPDPFRILVLSWGIETRTALVTAWTARGMSADCRNGRYAQCQQAV